MGNALAGGVVLGLGVLLWYGVKNGKTAGWFNNATTPAPAPAPPGPTLAPYTGNTQAPGTIVELPPGLLMGNMAPAGGN